MRFLLPIMILGFCGCVQHPFTKGPFGYMNQGFEKNLRARVMTNEAGVPVPVDLDADGKPDGYLWDLEIVNSGERAYAAEEAAQARLYGLIDRALSIAETRLAALSSAPISSSGPTRAELAASVLAIMADTTLTDAQRLQAIIALLR